jgi:hypothetical protein
MLVAKHVNMLLYVSFRQTKKRRYPLEISLRDISSSLFLFLRRSLLILTDLAYESSHSNQCNNTARSSLNELNYGHIPSIEQREPEGTIICSSYRNVEKCKHNL